MFSICMFCGGCGWCEGSPAFVCPRCGGTGTEAQQASGVARSGEGAPSDQPATHSLESLSSSSLRQELQALIASWRQQPQPYTFDGSTRDDGWMDGRQDCADELAELLRSSPLNEALAAVTRELVAAMRAYEMDVEGPAPQKHRDMIKRAEAALLRASTGTTTEDVSRVSGDTPAVTDRISANPATGDA